MKYRWKNDKTEVKVRKFGTGYQIATGGDFRKGYITFSEKEFENYFEPINNKEKSAEIAEEDYGI